jgi:hypothetical protein
MRTHYAGVRQYRGGATVKVLFIQHALDGAQVCADVRAIFGSRTATIARKRGSRTYQTPAGVLTICTDVWP